MSKISARDFLSIELEPPHAAPLSSASTTTNVVPRVVARNSRFEINLIIGDRSQLTNGINQIENCVHSSPAHTVIDTMRRVVLGTAPGSDIADTIFIRDQIEAFIEAIIRLEGEYARGARLRLTRASVTAPRFRHVCVQLTLQTIMDWSSLGVIG